MSEEMYSVEQVADHLGLHVRTVRGYIRSGRLNAVRIGKQYRIARTDLEALTGTAQAARSTAAAPVEVSSIVQIDGVDRAAADRLSTLIQSGANTGRNTSPPLRLQTVHDEGRNRMKIVVLGGPADTAAVLQLLDAVIGGDNGLVSVETGSD